MTENEMVGWHHRLNGHGFGWTLGVVDGQCNNIIIIIFLSQLT